MSETQTEFAIIGAGQCGVPLARALAAAGRSVMLIEAAHLGGSCVNFGCTPTKAAIESSRIAHQSRRAAEYGVHVGGVEVNFPAVIARARGFADASRHSLDDSFAGQVNPRLVRGHGKLAGRDGAHVRIMVGAETILAERVILNTGTRTAMPHIEGLDAVPVITAETWLEHDRLPAHLLILGGSYIGLEMAQFYGRMGAAVTVLTIGDQLAPREDPDVAKELQSAMEAEGIAVRLGVKIARVRAGNGVRLELEDGGGIDGSDLFIATGRAPNLDDLGLDTVGLTVEPGHPVKVDAHLATTAASIWAAGDIRGGPQFTHTAYDDFRVLQSLFLGDGKHTTKRVVPYAMFTDPELGRVGESETEARKHTPDAKVVRHDFADMGRAREAGRTRGFVKLVATPDGRHLLGAAVLGEGGAELVHVFNEIMNAGTDMSVSRDSVYIHPTFSEGVHQAVAKLLG